MEVSIVAFSDTHGHHEYVKLPTCDIAIFAGDMSRTGQKEEVERFLKWYNKQVQCSIRIYVAGNHDKSFDPKFAKAFGLDNHDWLQELKDQYSNLTYLQDSGIEAFGLKIWGSPWTPWFHGERWGFNAHRGDDIAEYWRMVPLDTDILVTHGPTHLILDRTLKDNELAGCEELRKVITQVDPKVHICGHIHEGYGMDYWTLETTFVNASFCNAYNVPTNPPIQLNLEV